MTHRLLLVVKSLHFYFLLHFYFVMLVFVHKCDFSSSVGLVLLISERKLNSSENLQTMIYRLSDTVPCEGKASMCLLLAG